MWFFNGLDHAAIFSSSLGTFNPDTRILFTGFLRWGMLVIIWLLAISGLIGKKQFFFTTIPEWFRSVFLFGPWMDGGCSWVFICGEDMALLLSSLWCSAVFSIRWGQLLEYHQKLTIIPRHNRPPRDSAHSRALGNRLLNGGLLSKALDQVPSI